MFRKRCIALLIGAALLSACTPVDEKASNQQIYYIEPSERFYVPEEDVTSAEPEITDAELTAAPESTSEETTSEETTAEETTAFEETTTVTEETTTAAETEAVTETITETVTEAQVQNVLYTQEFTPSETYVKPLGRTYCKNSGTRILSNTCSGIEFAFRGTSADITLTSNCKSSKARIAIYVNGEQFTDTMLTDEETTFHVFDSTESKNCIISVVKLSEAAYSYAGVKSITVTSEYGIIPTPERDRKIEFIGDSITCGYGIDAADQYEDFSTSNENGGKTYAALIAKHFKADLSVFSQSGIGVYSSYTESSSPNQTVLMPNLYGKTDPTNTQADWDFSQWQPDVVVINLGTNDNTWTKGIDERVNSFGGAYYDFIVQVRKANPNAYIICSLGVMGSKLLPEIKEQVSQYSADTGDYRITTFEFDYRDGTADGFGADYHPSAKTHQKMADKMIPFIEELMGWY